MGLRLEVFYSPNWVTWDRDRRGDEVRVAAYPRPQVALDIAESPLEPGELVLFGWNIDEMKNEVQVGDTAHLLILPHDDPTSRVVGTMQWTPRGLQLAACSANPILLREWGHQQVKSVEGSIDDKGRKIWHSIDSLGSRVVGTLPGYGAWFRTCPTADFPDTINEGDTPTPKGLEDDSLQRVRDVLFCPGRSGDVDHMLWSWSCADPGHATRQKRLAVLLAYYLRWLTWPPHGWKIPHEQNKHMPTRYAEFGYEAGTPPTARRNEIVEALTAAGLDVTEGDALDKLVDQGLISWSAVQQAIAYMHDLFPVDWKNMPDGHSHWDAIAEIRHVEHRTFTRR